MRHQKKINHLGRTSSHRKAMLANMASSLIMHKRISTTTAKAKALRIYVEPLLTKAKDDTTHSRRTVFSYLKNKEAVTELFREVAVKIGSRPGGYTRILKTGNRLGDNADMCIIELVDYNENMLAAKAETKAPAKRSRRGKKKSDTLPAAAPVAEKASPETIEKPAEEAQVIAEGPLAEEIAQEEKAEELVQEEKLDDEEVVLETKTEEEIPAEAEPEEKHASEENDSKGKKTE